MPDNLSTDNASTNTAPTMEFSADTESGARNMHTYVYKPSAAQIERARLRKEEAIRNQEEALNKARQQRSAGRPWPKRPGSESSTPVSSKPDVSDNTSFPSLRSDSIESSSKIESRSSTISNEEVDSIWGNKPINNSLSKTQENSFSNEENGDDKSKHAENGSNSVPIQNNRGFLCSRGSKGNRGSSSPRGNSGMRSLKQRNLATSWRKDTETNNDKDKNNEESKDAKPKSNEPSKLEYEKSIEKKEEIALDNTV